MLRSAATPSCCNRAPPLTTGAAWATTCCPHWRAAGLGAAVLHGRSSRGRPSTGRYPPAVAGHRVAAASRPCSREGADLGAQQLQAVGRVNARHRRGGVRRDGCVIEIRARRRTRAGRPPGRRTDRLIRLAQWPFRTLGGSAARRRVHAQIWKHTGLRAPTSQRSRRHALRICVGQWCDMGHLQSVLHPAYRDRRRPPTPPAAHTRRERSRFGLPAR